MAALPVNRAPFPASAARTAVFDSPAIRRASALDGSGGPTRVLLRVLVERPLALGRAEVVGLPAVLARRGRLPLVHHHAAHGILGHGLTSFGGDCPPPQE